MILQIIKKPNPIFVSLFIQNISYSRHSRSSNYVKFTVFIIFLFHGKFRSLILQELSSKICLLFLPCLWAVVLFCPCKTDVFLPFAQLPSKQPSLTKINTLFPRLLNCRPFFRRKPSLSTSIILLDIANFLQIWSKFAGYEPELAECN